MKKVDSGEFFHVNAEQFNSFAEYKIFPAEKFDTFESAKSPLETGSFSEHFNDGNATKTNSGAQAESNGSELRRQIEKANRAQSQSYSNDSSAASSGTSSSATASGASSSTSATSASAASASATASTAAVGASAVVVAVVVLAVITVGLFVNFGNYVTPVLGMDYVALTINIDDFIATEKVAAGLSAEDFWIEYETANGAQRMHLRSGQHTYLFTGLQPGTDFTYKVFCSESQYASETEYFSQTLTTSATSKPVGVLDEMNTNVRLDEQMKCAVLTYSVYLSDYNHAYNHATFFVCDAPMSDSGEISNALYAADMPDEDNFFRGEVFDITSKELFLYVVGESDDGSVVLFSHQLHVDIPDEWCAQHNDVFDVQAGSEVATCGFNAISVEGALSQMDKNQSFGVYFTQYGEDGTPILERVDAEMQVDTQQNVFITRAVTCYGLTAFRYTVYTWENDVETVVYQSQILQYTGNQDFTAVYNKVPAAEATVSYNSGGNVTVYVDPEFYAESVDMFYKVVAMNENGTIYGEYYGTGMAEISIPDCYGLNQLSLVYYDCANFVNGTWQYGWYSTESVQFCVPQVAFSETNFDGTNFTLAYTCNMIYDYSQAYLELEISDGESTYYQYADGLAESGVIVLDSITSELGNVTVSGTLSFVDYTTGGDVHPMQLQPYNCNLNYGFEITSVNADVSGGESTIPVTVNFNASMPQTYSVVITNADYSVNESVAVTENSCSFSVSANNDAQLTVSVTDKEGQVWGSYSYVVSKTAAEANYTAPSFMNSVNPGDALVTYNDDGTINIYRKIDFQCSNENVYYNAYVYPLVDNGDGLVPGDGYDVIGRDTYAVIEDLPFQNYYFTYYTMFDYNGVSYTMYTDIPSGGITFPESYGSYEVATSETETSVKISIPSNYGHLQNKVTVNGVDYQYTMYTDSYETYPTLTIDAAIDVVSVVIYHNPNISYYDVFLQEIPIKGTLYRAVTL